MPSTVSQSADEILASYLQQQEQLQYEAALNTSNSDNANNNKRRTVSKMACKTNKRPVMSHLDCNNLIGSTNTSYLLNGNNIMSPNDDSSSSSSNGITRMQEQATNIVHIQRKLLALFYIYVTIIVSLYLTYAVYCYYQQNQLKKQRAEPMIANGADQVGIIGESQQQTAGNQLMLMELETKFESKIQLLERYIEVLALDLESTKTRLGEREKCACQMNCLFNGTRYMDQEKWNQKCDICQCQAGKISCQPRECPKLSCAQTATLPGQCCPTCMKHCKVNNKLVPHGHSFKPTTTTTDGKDPRLTKQCKCHNGLIKCEPMRVEAAQYLVPKVGAQLKSANKTIEYLKSILGNTKSTVTTKLGL